MCGLLLGIVSLFNLAPVHDLGYRGEGKTIAIIDAGFYRANDENVFPKERIVGVYDLLQGDTLSRDTFDMFSDRTNAHGCMCLSTMLYDDEKFTGTAPDANYILFRSEDIYAEYYEEEVRLARAIHMADSLGADIITISLGYNRFDNNIGDHSYRDMTGQGVAAQAATEAVRNGRFVCVAAGNDGNNDWHYISTPADADSILTVGAVMASGEVASFSSYGPSYDGRIKPEVAAMGQATTIYIPTLVDDSTHQVVGGVSVGNGTSFATPEVAGMVACLWQAFPHLSSMQLRRLIIENASQYASADCRIGYGIPDAWQTYSALATAVEAVSAEQKCEKRIENGRVVIIRDGIRYSILGNRL